MRTEALQRRLPAASLDTTLAAPFPPTCLIIRSGTRWPLDQRQALRNLCELRQARVPFILGGHAAWQMRVCECMCYREAIDLHILRRPCFENVPF